MKARKIYNFPFLRSDLELVLWPLALLHLVLPNPIALLWVQDLATAGTGLVTYLWILDTLQERRTSRREAAVAATCVLIAVVVSPGSYETGCSAGTPSPESIRASSSSTRATRSGGAMTWPSTSAAFTTPEDSGPAAVILAA